MQSSPRISKRVAANQVRPAEPIAEGALRLFDMEGHSIDVYVLNAKRTGMLHVLFEGKPFAAMPKQAVACFTPEGIEERRTHLSAAEVLMYAAEDIAYAQDVALDHGTLSFRAVMRYLRTTDGEERFNEVQIEGFALPE